MNTHKLFLIVFLAVAMLSSMVEADGIMDKITSAINSAKATVEEKLGKGGNKMAEKAAEAADTMAEKAAEAAAAAEETVNEAIEATEEVVEEL